MAGSAFQRLAATLVADPNVASDAAYGEGGGAGDGVPVRVILRQPDRVGTFGDSRFLSSTILIEVKIAHAPNLAVGDWFKIDGVTWEVRADPQRDTERLFWTAEVREI